MIKKLVCIISFTIIMHSCSIFKTTNSSSVLSNNVEESNLVEKFIGEYEITAYDLPGYGDQKFKITIEETSNGLVSSFESTSLAEFDIIRTKVEDGILYIDIYVEEFSLKTYFEIYVDGNTVTGYLADMFELQGMKYPLIESDENIPKNISSLIIGDYTITFYDVPGYGEINAIIKIFFKKNILNSEVSYFNGESWVNVTVNRTEVEDEAVFINVVDEEAGGNVDLEIYFDDQKTISGFYAGQFKFKGERIK